MPKPSRLNDIIETAYHLFNEHGYYATGIDLIISESKISKKTLYTYFRSKEELIVAVLKYSADLFERDFIPAVEKSANSAQDQLLAVFDASKAWSLQNKFFGCMFISAVAEYADHGAIRDVCQAYKLKIRTFIESLCEQADLHEPKQLASELALLLEGVIVTSQVSRDNTASETAKTIAKHLIQEHSRAPF